MAQQRLLTVRPLAQEDIDGLAIYLEKDSQGMGRHLLTDLESACSRLIAFPEIGPLWPTENTRLAGLRRLVLPRFGISVFYFAHNETIEIVRVLHHARDLPPLIEDL